MKVNFVLDSIYTQNLIKALIESDEIKNNKLILIYRNSIKNISEEYLKYIILIKRTTGIFRFADEFKVVEKYIKDFKEINFHYLSFEALWIINKFKDKVYGWFLWGGDFYPYIKINQYSEETRKIIVNNNQSKGFKDRFLEHFMLFFRKRAIKNIKYIYTWNNYDYSLLKDNFNTNAEFRYFTYPYVNDYENLDILCNLEKDSDEIVIQVGNSGDATNNHLEIFKSLEKFKDKNFIVITPLSYGDKDYIEKLIVEGHKILGDKFKPINNKLPLNEYSKQLARVDVAIMNHYRQQGAGNIVSLLYLGKKVYLNREVTTYKTFKEWGIDIYSIDDLNDSFEEIIKLDGESIDKNRCIIRNKFSNEVCL